MKKVRRITWEQALAIHEMQLAETGGGSGMRDEGLLHSALAKPNHLLAYAEPSPTIPELAAAYAYGIANNHPFLDGNKRTAFVLSVVFLELNGYELRASQADAYVAFMELAKGTFSQAELAAWFERHSDPIARR
jgi:death-on-curing protein